MAKTNKQTTTNAIPSLGNDVEQLEFSYIVGRKMKWESHFGNSLEVSYKVKPKTTILYISVKNNNKSGCGRKDGTQRVANKFK